MPFPIDNFGEVKVTDNRVEWVLKFSGNLPDEDDLEINSPDFLVDDLKWNLRLYPNGHTYSDEHGWIEMALTNATFIDDIYRGRISKGIRFNVRMSVIGEHGQEVLKFIPEVDDKNTWYKENKVIKRKEFDKNKERFFRDNTLVIFCEIRKDEETETDTGSRVDMHV